MCQFLGITDDYQNRSSVITTVTTIILTNEKKGTITENLITDTQMYITAAINYIDLFLAKI